MSREGECFPRRAKEVGRATVSKESMAFFFFCSEFCHTLEWNSHGFTCVPHPDPPSHLSLHPLPLGFPSAPGPSACLMHRVHGFYWLHPGQERSFSYWALQSVRAPPSGLLSSVQVISVAQPGRTLWDPMNCRMTVFPVHHQLLTVFNWSFTSLIFALLNEDVINER